MIGITTLALLTMNAYQQGPSVSHAPLTCAIMGGNADKTAPGVDYKGVHYAFCCPMCPGAFAKNPEKAINADRNKGQTIGEALFDPVSQTRIQEKDAKASSDVNGVRYLFASTDEKAKFDASPAQYTAVPAKEALYCPVEKEAIKGYASAGSYRDYNGVRYFFCCNGCPQQFDKKPADYAKVAAMYVTDPKAVVVAPPPQPAAAAAEQPFVAETFNCKHCGRQMTVNSPADLNATCSACQCGKTCSQCKPSGGQK